MSPHARRALLALSLLPATLLAAPEVGPGSEAWRTDLAALEAAVAADGPDLEATLAEFFETHQVVSSIARLRRALGLFPVMTSGRSDPPDPARQQPRYRLCAIAGSKYPVVKYHRKLEALLPEVDAGERTLVSARKKAARWFKYLGWANRSIGLQVADLKEDTGVFVVSPMYEGDNDRLVEIHGLSHWDPDRYQTYYSSWEDMTTRIALDAEYRIVAIDREERAAGLRSLVVLLRNLGELAPELPPAS